MFTGIVTDVGEILDVKVLGENLRRIKIGCAYARSSIADGASIACSGVCLTVVGAGEEGGRPWFSADAAAETLCLTTVGTWQAGTRINLERALKAGDELGGHLVSGHVDGLAEIVSRENMPEMARITFRMPKELSRFVAQKGSVAIDGVSLTVNEVKDDTFSVLIIPHTLKVTTLNGLRMGDRVNLEVDQLARYVARFAETAIMN